METTLGEFIRSRREELGLTQQVLADRIGTSRPYLSQIEGGHSKWPQALVPGLARELHVSQAHLAAVAGLIDFEDASNERQEDPRFLSLVERLRKLSPEQWTAILAYSLILSDPRLRDPEFIKGAQERG